MAMNSVVSNMNRLFPTIPVTGPELCCDGPCGRLLRDANGKQVLDDVCTSRRSCPHVFCAKCLLAGTVQSAREGTVFMCPQCVDPQDRPWVSWDVRSRRQGTESTSTSARAQGGPRKKRKGSDCDTDEVDAGVYEVQKGGWGRRRPEEAIFFPEVARKFHAEQVPENEHGQTGVVCVLTHEQGGGVATRCCRLSADEGTSTDRSVCSTLAALGSLLRQTIVKSAAAGWRNTCHAANQLVDFGSIVGQAGSDKSRLVTFMRSMCCRLTSVPQASEMATNPAVRKDVLASWAAAQLLVGRQSIHGDNIIGPLQSFMGWGLRYLGTKVLAIALQSIGLCSSLATALKNVTKRGQARYQEKLRSIPRGAYLAFALDNIRWRVHTKIWGDNRNLEFTQQSIRVFRREDYRRLGVADAKCWKRGPSREEVARNEALCSRLTTELACLHLVTREKGKLELGLDLQEVEFGAADTSRQSPGEEPLLSRADPACREDDDPVLPDDADDVVNEEDLEGDALDSDHAQDKGDEGRENDVGRKNSSMSGDEENMGLPTAGEREDRWQIGPAHKNRPRTVYRVKRGKVIKSTSALGQDVIMCPIVRKDFSKGETLRELSHQAEAWTRALMKLPQDSDFTEGQIDCPLHGEDQDVQHVRLPILVDGKPAIQAITASPSEQLQASRTFFSAQGWHTCKAALKHLCRLFEHLIVPIIKQYGRQTPGQIAWFVDPSDPRQCDNESRGIRLAILVQAAQSYMKTVTNRGDASWQGLYAHMRKRAADCPLARDVFMWVTFQGTIEAIQESAGDRDFETYHRLLPILGLLFSVTHATGYEMLVWEELVRYQTLSEAERALFRELVFYRTAAGTSVFADYWVETTNRFLRKYTGHFVRGNADNFADFIDSVLLGMEELQARAGATAASTHSIFADSEDDSPALHTLSLGHVFCMTMRVIGEVNVWGPGALRPLGARRGTNARAETPASYHITIDGLARDPEFDRVLAIAEDRVKWFRDTALSTNGWSESLVGKPSIGRVAALKKTKHSEDRATWVMNHGSNEEDLLQSKATVVFLQQQLTLLKKKVKGKESGKRGQAEKTPPVHCSSNASRPELVKAVCTLRKQLLDLGEKSPAEPELDWKEVDVQGKLGLVDSYVSLCMEHPLMDLVMSSQK